MGRKEGRQAGRLLGELSLSTVPATSSPLAHLIFLSSPNKKNTKRACFITTTQFPVGDRASAPVNVRRAAAGEEAGPRPPLTRPSTQAPASLFSPSEQLNVMGVKG